MSSSVTNSFAKTLHNIGTKSKVDSKFSSFKEMMEFEPNCPYCEKPMKKHFASGTYERIIHEGFKGRTDPFKLARNKLSITRSFKINPNDEKDNTGEIVDVTCRLDIDTETNKFNAVFLTPEQEIVDKLPLHRKFYELNIHPDAMSHAIAQGLVSIWKAFNLLASPIYFIQECKDHFRRVHFTMMDPWEEEFTHFTFWDEISYVKNVKEGGDYFVTLKHCSPSSKYERVFFVMMRDKKNRDHLDQKAGGFYLYDDTDERIINNLIETMQTKDLERISKKLYTLYALKSG